MGDRLTASSVRKIQRVQDTGTISTERTYLNIKIKAKSLDFDPKVSLLRVSGQIVDELSGIAQGQHHTLALELNRKFTLEKADGWDSVAKEMLREAIVASSKAHTFVVMMMPGDAKIYRVTENRTVFEQSVQQTMPSKMAGSSDSEKVNTIAPFTNLD